MQVLYFHWYAAYHKYYFVSYGGNVLVHPALQVGELAAYFCFSMYAHADLVADDDKRSCLLQQLLYLLLTGCEALVYIVFGVDKEIGEP
jgi:hypothetical protein